MLESVRQFSATEDTDWIHFLKTNKEDFEMAFMDRIKKIISTSDEDYYDDDFDETEEYEDEYDDYEKPAPRRAEPAASNTDKVVNIHTTAQVQVVLVQPEQFEDAQSIADHLNARKTVVLNLESADKDVSRRIVDFLSGVAYANRGQVKRVAKKTFMITPYDVDVIGGDILDKLENNGMFFD